MSDKIFRLLASAVSCLLLLVVGCAQTSTLALRFTPQDSTTYRVIREREKSVEVEGALSKETIIEGGHTGSKVEMIFSQQIQSVDDEGNAIAKITIEQLKYFAKVKDKTEVDFDSLGAEGRRNPLARLVGQSYGIKVSSAGEVIGVLDVREARAVVRGGTATHQAALALLKPEVIKARHAILGLPAAGKNQVRKGDSWSSIKSFSYGMMGSETYERIYTLKDVKEADGRRIALVEMNAIPSSEMAEQLHKEQATSMFSEMFDSKKTYTGELKLDLTAGRVEKCFEKMQMQWVVVDTSIKPGDDKMPAALKMGVIQLYSLERID